MHVLCTFLVELFSGLCIPTELPHSCAVLTNPVGVIRCRAVRTRISFLGLSRCSKHWIQLRWTWMCRAVERLSSPAATPSNGARCIASALSTGQRRTAYPRLPAAKYLLAGRLQVQSRPARLLVLLHLRLAVAYLKAQQQMFRVGLAGSQLLTLARWGCNRVRKRRHLLSLRCF